MLGDVICIKYNAVNRVTIPEIIIVSLNAGDV